MLYPAELPDHPIADPKGSLKPPFVSFPLCVAKLIKISISTKSPLKPKSIRWKSLCPHLSVISPKRPRFCCWNVKIEFFYSIFSIKVWYFLFFLPLTRELTKTRHFGFIRRSFVRICNKIPRFACMTILTAGIGTLLRLSESVFLTPQQRRYNFQSSNNKHQ